VALPDGLVENEDGIARCWWGGGKESSVGPGIHPGTHAVLLRTYHDDEWGMPVTDDVRLFEKLTLEGFQAGLSWLTILRKREAFRRAFAGFDFRRVARFGRRDVDRLLADASIVRHRGKIESAINNARRAEELVDEAGSLAAFVWRFEPPPSARPARMTREALMGLAQTDESRTLAKELKRRGWTFVGPTTVYAFMQAMGLVDDHLDGCAARQRVEAARDALLRPD
jgi:DNA-3-methyladenine glycosylase I